MTRTYEPGIMIELAEGEPSPSFSQPAYRIVAIDDRHNRRALVMVDRNGDLIPGQRDVVLKQAMGCVTEVTITFVLKRGGVELDI